MSDFDLIVVGAGPAGAAAAVEAAALGLSTVVVDEQAMAGGQVHRAPVTGDPAGAATEGAALRRELASSSAAVWSGCRVWMMEPGFSVSAIGAEGLKTARAPALILGVGAQERAVPVEGWTLPGVYGLAAATVMLKSHGITPGQRVVVAGQGPLLLLVAAGVLEAGGEVAAVIDARPLTDWLAKAPTLASRPDLVLRGAGWQAKLTAAGVPMLRSHALVRIEGEGAVERVVAAPLDATGAPIGEGATRRFDCDAVCYGFGLSPATEATRLLGADHAWRPERGGWTVTADADQRTTVAGLFACGDGASVLGAAAAPLRGRIAALAAARDLGRLSPDAFEERAAPLRRRLAPAGRFGAAMTELCAPRAGEVALIGADAVVCRCEGVTRSRVDGAIAGGAASLNSLKQETRAGMGPCGGRYCGEACAQLIAARTGQSREAIGMSTGRPPLRPTPIAPIVAGFDYADIPMPAPAPL